MTDILRPLIIMLLLAVSFSAYFLVIGALFSNRVEKTRRAVNQWTARSFGVGFVNFLFFGVIAAVLLIVTDANANRVSSIVRAILLIPTLGVLGFLGILLSVGLTGVVNELGAKLFSEYDNRKQTVLGGVVLTFACALPFVGWFLLLPYVGLVGIGAMILGFFQRDVN